MGQTKIEWTSYQKPDGTIVPGYTFNPVIGCSKKSPGCKHCYAEHDTPARVSRARKIELWGPDGQRQIASVPYWKQPKAWNLAAQLNNERRLVFTASQSDWLEDRPEWEAPRAQLLKTILETPNLIWLLLSKEPWNLDRLVRQAAAQLASDGHHEQSDILYYWLDGWWLLRNVRLGVSVENQEWADKRRDAFAKLPGSKFVSYEPALGPVDWSGWEFVDQIISGGESGKDDDIRPSHPDWHRATRDWCARNGKAFFFKQWGKYGAGSVRVSTGEPVFRFFESKQQWINKGNTWVNGGVCLDMNGKLLKRGADFDNAAYPVVITHKIGKEKSGNHLYGRQHLEIPGINFFPTQEAA